MSFDLLAPHYRWLEAVLAGGKLQRCRLAFLNKAKTAGEILILGEGNGRFLMECRRVAPAARIVTVDSSAKMLELSRRRVLRAGLGIDGINFVHADARAWMPPPQSYDLIVTHFFLDCFPAADLDALVAKLARTTRPGAAWLVSDFHLPVAGPTRWRAALILKSMYLFFRLATRLPAASLVNPASALELNGFHLVESRESEWGLLRAEHWKRD